MCRHVHVDLCWYLTSSILQVVMWGMLWDIFWLKSKFKWIFYGQKYPFLLVALRDNITWYHPRREHTPGRVRLIRTALCAEVQALSAEKCEMSCVVWLRGESRVSGCLATVIVTVFSPERAAHRFTVCRQNFSCCVNCSLEKALGTTGLAAKACCCNQIQQTEVNWALNMCLE